MTAERSVLGAVSGALPASAAASLEQTGFVVLPGPFSAERFDAVVDAYDTEVQLAVTDDVRVGSTSTRVTDFVSRGPVFDPLYVYPPLLDAAALVVGRGFKLSSLHARTLRAGADVLDIHVDVERDSRDWPLLGFILMIDAFGPDNGATRFLPGSHQWTSSLRGARLQDHAAQLVPACGPAGSLLVFNGSTWHGQGINRSGGPRRSLQGAFIPRDGRAATDFSSRMSAATRERLGAVAQYVLALRDVGDGVLPGSVESR
jgi:hypothetical protein